MEPLTLEEYAVILREHHKKLSEDQAVDLAQETFIKRGKNGLPPITRYDIEFPAEQIPGLETPFEATPNPHSLDFRILGT